MKNVLSRHNVAALAFVVVVAAVAAFKAFGSDPLDFKSLADAKVFLESKGLHCHLTKDGLNVSMVVMDKPFSMTIQDQARVDRAIGGDERAFPFLVRRHLFGAGY